MNGVKKGDEMRQLRSVMHEDLPQSWLWVRRVCTDIIPHGPTLALPSQSSPHPISDPPL